MSNKLKAALIAAGILAIGAISNTSTPASALSTECLVLASASTTCPTTALVSRRAIEIQNLGPNAIFCRPDSTAAVLNKAHKVAPGDAWTMNLTDDMTMRCIAATADQVTTAASIITELR